MLLTTVGRLRGYQNLSFVNPFSMDPFRQDSNPNIVNKQQGQHNHSIHSTTLATQGNFHTHQTLPSFKEVLAAYPHL